MGQQYLAQNADVMNDAIARANAEGLTGGDAFSNRLDEIALSILIYMEDQRADLIWIYCS